MGFRRSAWLRCVRCCGRGCRDRGCGRRPSGRGWDRKTARRYVAAAEAAGLVRDVGVGAVTDELVGQVVDAVRPARPDGHGGSWELLLLRA